MKKSLWFLVSFCFVQHVFADCADAISQMKNLDFPSQQQRTLKEIGAKLTFTVDEKSFKKTNAQGCDELKTTNISFMEYAANASGPEREQIGEKVMTVTYRNTPKKDPSVKLEKNELIIAKDFDQPWDSDGLKKYLKNVFK